MTATMHAVQPSLMPGYCTCGAADNAPVHGFTESKVVEFADPVMGVRTSQQEILALFREYGPMTDEVARERYTGNQSASGFRTRRSELVNQGLLVDSGFSQQGTTGRKMTVWRAR